MSILSCVVHSLVQEASANTDCKVPKQSWGEETETETKFEVEPKAETETEDKAEPDGRDEADEEEEVCADRDKKVPGASWSF